MKKNDSRRSGASTLFRISADVDVTSSWIFPGSSAANARSTKAISLQQSEAGVADHSRWSAATSELWFWRNATESPYCMSAQIHFARKGVPNLPAILGPTVARVQEKNNLSQDIADFVMFGW